MQFKIFDFPIFSLYVFEVEFMTTEEIMNSDYCSREGAARLQETIRNYWRKQGFDVDIQLVNEAFVPAMRSARTDVRSNMVNGMPRFGQAA